MTGKQFRQHRRELALTHPEMGEALGGYTRRSIIGWEQGQSRIPPAVEKLILIFRREPKFICFPEER